MDGPECDSVDSWMTTNGHGEVVSDDKCSN